MHISILKEGLNGGKKQADELVLQHLCFEETTLKQGGISAIIQLALENADKAFNYLKPW